MLNVTTDFEYLLLNMPYEEGVTEEIYRLERDPIKCYIEIVVYNDKNEKELSQIVITSDASVDESLEVLMISLGDRGYYEACLMIEKYLESSITQ